MSARTFRVVRTADAAKEVAVGELVYEYLGYDYGLSSDDERVTGIKHVSVTRDPAGGAPFFTIPLRDVEEVLATPLGGDRPDFSTLDLLTVRDVFLLGAEIGLLVAGSSSTGFHWTGDTTLAETAGRIADAMLAERAKRRP